MDNTEIFIESAHIDDIKNISRIFGQYYVNDQDDVDPEEIEYFSGLIEKSVQGVGSDPTELYLVAKNKQNDIWGIAGYRNAIKKFLPYTKTQNPLEIYVLFVDKNHSRHGIGKQLVTYIQSLAINKGYTEIVVRSAFRFKDSGWVFYKKIGFEEVGSLAESGGGESKIFRLVL